jgi:hypothetical protein
MIAEDYRQLFGSPAGRLATQENREIPPATDVLGLKVFLRDVFTQLPASLPAPDPSTSPSPEPTATASPTPIATSSSAPAPDPTPTQPAAQALDITDLTVSPRPVKSSATIEFLLSTTARVTVRILDAKGKTIRTLCADAASGGGRMTLTWDRKNASGRRAPAGAYSVRVDATSSSGSTTSSLDFLVA